MRPSRRLPSGLLTVNGQPQDERRTWAATKRFDEHIAARYADLKARNEAATALLGMGLTVAALFVLTESTGWPSLKQAREWQSLAHLHRARLEGVAV